MIVYLAYVYLNLSNISDRNVPCEYYTFSYDIWNIKLRFDDMSIKWLSQTISIVLILNIHVLAMAILYDLAVYLLFKKISI